MLNDPMDTTYILTYPTRHSLIEATLAAIERRANVEKPAGYEYDDPIYLTPDEATQSQIFRHWVDSALRDAEPPPGLWDDLQEFQWLIVADIIVGLESTPDGRDFLSDMRAAAAQRYSDQLQNLRDAT